MTSRRLACDAGRVVMRHDADEQIVEVGARTMCSGWLGEPLDVGWALDVLHPRALEPLAIGE